MIKYIINPGQSSNLSPSVCAQLRPLGLKIDSSVVFSRNLMFERGVCFVHGCSVIRAKVGSYSYCGHDTNLTTTTVGRYCSIAHNVEFGLGAHQITGVTSSLATMSNPFFMDYSGVVPFTRDQKRPDGEETAQITIGHDVWIGCNCLFPKDVTIGHGAVIGAGSVITHDVPPYAIVAGAGGGANSKGIIKGYRFPDEVISDLLELNWWDYDLPKMLVQGIKVPLKDAKDFITFMKNEEREHLIPLPEHWYYLNILNANSVQLFRVDPEQTYMGSLIDPAQIAVLEDVGLAQHQAQQVAAQQAAQQKAREDAWAKAEAQARALEEARTLAQVQAMMQFKTEP